MDFISADLDRYITDFSSEEPQLLAELRQATHQKVLMPRMLSGPVVGGLLALLSKLQKPKRILEIGTYTGYGTLCLAEGLGDQGFIHTIDSNEELQKIQDDFFERSDYTDKIIRHMGDARSIIETLDEDWDLVFLDADKENYPVYFELLVKRMKSGALLIADNVLWSGKVLQPAPKTDLPTKGLQLFNKRIREDKRTEVVMLPVRDGISLCRIR